jgi:UDP-N-acetyl-D-galactosamine dehydrogenase
LLNIDTNDVLAAASTKWNFLNFKPGLVGGHCIGVDPYYLAYKAESLGYYPQVILSGRRVNDQMGSFVASKVVKLLINKGNKVSYSKALILGVTFKENCPDIRNSKVADIVSELEQFGMNVDVFDPLADKEEVKHEYGITLIDSIQSKYDAVVLAVAHDVFNMLNFSNFLSGPTAVIFDTKSHLDRALVDSRL